MIAWSAIEVHRFAETQDFTGFYRAWYLIGHGVLNPGPGWIGAGSGWWKTQGIFIMWPLALAAVPFPHPVTLLITQDLAVVLAELVAYLWLLDIAERRPSLALSHVAVFALAIIVLNPWIYWCISGDYHSEAVGALFMILSSRALYDGRRSGWLWAVLALASGLVPATYMLGVAIGLSLTRGRRRVALVLALITCVWLFVMLKLGVGGGLLGASDKQFAQTSSDPIGGVLHEIHIVVDAVPDLWPQMLALLAPSLFFGALAAPVVGVAAIVLGTGATAGLAGLSQFFQNVALFVYMPVGTVIVLIFIARRFGVRVARVAMLCVLVSAVGWSAAWIGAAAVHYLRVSDRQANAVRAAVRLIPPSADLVASQGVVGVLSGRSHVWPLTQSPPFTIPMPRAGAWILVTPYAGVETENVAQSASIIQRLGMSSHAKLEYAHDGVWLFHWFPSRHASSLTVPKTASKLNAALFETQGSATTERSLGSWSASNDGRPVMVLYGDYWDKRPGRYDAAVVAASRGPFIVGLWNATTGSLLQQQRLSRTNGLRTIRLQGRITRTDPRAVTDPYRGVGPFAIDPIPAAGGNNLEVRVQSLGRAQVSVRWVSIHKVSPTDSQQP